MIITVIGTGILVAGFIYMIIRDLKIDVGQRFEKMDSRLDFGNDKLEGWIKHSIAMQSEQSKRTDKLYEMYVETQLEIKKLHIQNAHKK